MVQRITIKEIAQLAGVSVGAVSTVFSKRATNVHLSEETRKRILQIAQENHYVPSITARAMQSRKSYLLGFFYPSSNWYLQTGILKGIREVCSECDYDIIVYPASSLEEEAHNLQSSHVSQLDGIITVPMWSDGKSNERLYRSLQQRGVPVVQLLSRIWNDLPMIGRDYRKIGFEAVRALHSKGHRRIGVMIFANYLDPVGGRNNYILMQGIQAGALEFGMSLETYPLEVSVNGMNLVQESEKMAEQLIHAPNRPTALVTASSNLAYGAYACFARNHWSVPEYISLLACGDDTEPFWQLAPDLAYFPVPLEEMGRYSAQYCLEMQPSPALTRLFFSPLSEGHTIGSPLKNDAAFRSGAVPFLKKHKEMKQ